MFRTTLCDHFDEDNPASWRCVWKRRCAHSHGRDDVRSKEEATEEWRAHLTAALPQSSSQMPSTTMHRLLSAGAAALDTLSSSSAAAGGPMGGSKGHSRGGSISSPSSHLGHRRSVSGLSRDGVVTAGTMQAGGVGIGMRAQSSSARVPQLSFQPLQIGDASGGGGRPYGQNDMAMSPHTQPGTPLLQQQQLQQQQQQGRTPVLLHSTIGGGVPSSTHSSSGSSSGGSPVGQELKVGSIVGVSESRTPLGLSGGLGFFSSAESQLWAPSPKSQPPPVAHSVQQNIGSQSAGPQTRHLERHMDSRFVFDTASQQQHMQMQQTTQQMQQQQQPSDPAAAWAVAAKLDEFDSHTRRPSSSAGFLPSGGLLHSHASSSSSSLLLLEDSKLLSPHPSDIAPVSSLLPASVVVVSSPSPDSQLLASIPSNMAAANLWTSPMAAVVTDEQTAAAGFVRQLASHLQCACVDTNGAAAAAGASPCAAHTLVAPVSTQCCGLSLCKSCVDSYLAQCKVALASSLKKEITQESEVKSAESPVESPVPIESDALGVCKCGFTIHAEHEQQLRSTAVNQALQTMLEWLRQLENGHGGGGNSSNGADPFRSNLSPPPTSVKRLSPRLSPRLTPALDKNAYQQQEKQQQSQSQSQSQSEKSVHSA